LFFPLFAFLLLFLASAGKMDYTESWRKTFEQAFEQFYMFKTPSQALLSIDLASMAANGIAKLSVRPDVLEPHHLATAVAEEIVQYFCQTAGWPHSLPSDLVRALQAPHAGDMRMRRQLIYEWIMGPQASLPPPPTTPTTPALSSSAANLANDDDNKKQGLDLDSVCNRFCVFVFALFAVAVMILLHLKASGY
jgi:hypothetical protein